MAVMQQTKEELSLLVQEKMNEIMNHLAWHGDLTGLGAETLLRMQSSGTYLLRQGETGESFYLSYVVGTDLNHLPIIIDSKSGEWFYQNSCGHYAHTLDVFIPEIMHREENQCHPLAQFAKTRS